MTGRVTAEGIAPSDARIEERADRGADKVPDMAAGADEIVEIEGACEQTELPASSDMSSKFGEVTTSGEYER